MVVPDQACSLRAKAAVWSGAGNLSSATMATPDCDFQCAHALLQKKASRERLAANDMSVAAR